MAPSAHYRFANGSMWSRKLFFGRPLWQLTLAGSALLATGMVPTAYTSWKDRYASYRVHQSSSQSVPTITSSMDDLSHMTTEHLKNIDMHEYGAHHPHVHTDTLRVLLSDVPQHNMLVSRLEKERQWIMFG
jgi:hypothetical protein